MTYKLIFGLLLSIQLINLRGVENSGFSGHRNIPKDIANNLDDKNNVAKLKSLLNQLSETASNLYFQKHCMSILSVIDSKSELSSADSLLLNKMYTTFSDETIQGNASNFTSYTQRERPFIVSWVSPTDGITSLAWLILPENWDPEKTYPLYVRLHGLNDAYSNPIEYMAYDFDPATVLDVTFEDGYTLLPWGRGNCWYMGIGETDVWESISDLESFVKIDPTKKYLVGFSMGGYGSWYIGERSPDTWAALGVLAGALWYNNSETLNMDLVSNLKDVPTYITCGTDDGLLSSNETAYNELQQIGNTDIYFTTFPGGHVASVETWRSMYEWIRNYTNDRISLAIDNNDDIVHSELISGFPNPFNNSTSIQYETEKDGNLEIIIYNNIGEEVRNLVSSYTNKGKYTVIWDGSNNSGKRLPSGSYICKFKSQYSTSYLKLLFVK